MLVTRYVSTLYFFNEQPVAKLKFLLVVYNFQNDNGMGIPVELTSFVGRSALFKIEVKNFQGQRFDRSRFETSYRVKRVCTDQSIIEQFKTLQLDNSVGVSLPYFCYVYLPNAGPDLNEYGIKVGASSSRLLLTPQSTLNPEAVKHEELAKVYIFRSMLLFLLYHII